MTNGPKAETFARANDRLFDTQGHSRDQLLAVDRPGERGRRCDHRVVDRAVGGYFLEGSKKSTLTSRSARSTIETTTPQVSRRLRAPTRQSAELMLCRIVTLASLCLLVRRLRVGYHHVRSAPEL